MMIPFKLPLSPPLASWSSFNRLTLRNVLYGCTPLFFFFLHFFPFYKEQFFFFFGRKKRKRKRQEPKMKTEKK